MIIKCKKCMDEYNVYLTTDKEDNIISSKDKYVVPTVLNKKEYIGINCNCGAMNIIRRD